MFVLVGKEKSENIKVKRSDEEVNLTLDNKDVKIYAGNIEQEQEFILSLNDVAYALKQNHTQTVEDLCAMVSLLQKEVNKVTTRGNDLETSLQKERDNRKAKSKEYERYIDQLLEKTNNQRETIEELKTSNNDKKFIGMCITDRAIEKCVKKSTYDSVVKEVEDLKADNDKMFKLRYDLITECQNIKGHNTSLKSENEKFKEDINNLKNEFSEANLKNHRLTTELEELKSQHQIVVDSNEHLKFDVKHLQSENEKCIKEANGMQFSLTAIKKDNDSILKKYGELSLQYKTLEKNDTVSNNFSIHYAEISDETFKKELEKIQSTCAWTAQGLKEEQNKCTNLKQENEKLTERVSHLNDSYNCLLNSSNETIENLKSELEISKAVCKSAKAQFSDLHDKCKETITCNTAQKHKIKEALNKLSAAEDKCIFLKQELKNSNKNSKEAMIAEFERRREYYVDTTRKLTEQRNKANKFNEELSDELEKVKDLLTDKTKELEILIEKHNESKNDVVHYLNLSEEYKQDVFKSKDEIGDLKMQKEKLVEQLKYHKDAIRDLRMQKERLELNLRDSSHHYNCLIESTDKLSKEHKQLQVDFNKLTRSNIDRKKTLKDLNAKYEFLQENLDDATKDCECLQKNRNELRTANEKLQQEVMQIKCSKILVEKKLDDLVEEYKSSNLEVGNKMLTQALDETKHKLETAENNLIEVTESYDTAKEEITNLKTQTSGLRKELGELKYKYEKVQDRYKEIATGKTINDEEKLSEYEKQLKILKEKHTIELKENERLSADLNSLQCTLLCSKKVYDSTKAELDELINKYNILVSTKSDGCNKEQISKYEMKMDELNSSMKCWKKLQEETLERLNVSQENNKILTNNQQNPLGLKIDRLRLLLLKTERKITEEKYKEVNDVLNDAEKLVRINKQCVNELTPIIKALNEVDDAKDVDWRIFVK